MYAVDFEYDGLYLSDYGFIVCNFKSASGAETIESGAKITFNTVLRNGGRLHSLASTKYDECIKATFHICKNPDIYDDMTITAEEYRALARWLNRKEFLKFRPFDNEKELVPCYYEASFNIDKVKINELLYGIELNMVTNRPFGFGDEVRKVYEFSDISESHILHDISDEIGHLYPTMNITCYEDGDLTISNDMTNCEMTVRNCTDGEIITINGDLHSINSSIAEHDIHNDFNYDYFKIGNTINNRDNVIKANLPCKIELSYFPTIKNSL